MRTLRLLLEAGKPRILALMCLLALEGAALSPDFLSPAFPPTRLAGTAPLRYLAGRWPEAFTPPLWSLYHALGAALVVGLLWLGTALINDVADQAIDLVNEPHRPLPSGRIGLPALLRWGLGLQAAGFLLVLADGSRTALLMALLFAGLGNAYSLPPFRLRRSGMLATLIIGGGIALAMLGGMLAQTGVTEVGLITVLSLGLLGGAVSLIKDFKDVAGDRAGGIRTLPVMLGIPGAVAATGAAVAGAYVLSLVLLLQRTGVVGQLVGCYAGALGATLYLLVRVRGEPAFARQAHACSVLIFMGVTVLHVGAQTLH